MIDPEPTKSYETMNMIAGKLIKYLGGFAIIFGIAEMIYGCFNPEFYKSEYDWQYILVKKSPTIESSLTPYGAKEKSESNESTLEKATQEPREGFVDINILSIRDTDKHYLEIVTKQAA